MTTYYYKAARANGWDGRTGNTTNYRSHIGETVAPPNPNPFKNWVCRAGILHACGTLWRALHVSEELIAKGYGRSIYRVTGTPCCKDCTEENLNACTYGFVEMTIVEELTQYYQAP